VVFLLYASAAFGQESLPPGPGQTIALNACVQCHDFRWLVSQRKPEAAWRRTVNEMVWRGAPLLPGEAEVVARYLASQSVDQAKQKAETRGATDPFARNLPPGPGRALVLASCVQCHDLGITVSQRKSLDGWRQNVERMAHLGARLNGREIETVAAYLARAFGTKSNEKSR
jgi:cytochrome c553